MNRMVKSRKRQGGGGQGSTYGFTGGDAVSLTMNNPVMGSRAPSTDMAAVRPGYMGGAPSGHGLPGVQGGGTRKKMCKHNCGGKCKHKCCKKKARFVQSGLYKQSGGRYGFDGGSLDGTVNGPPWGAGIAPVSRVPCETSTSAPVVGGASGTLNMRGGELWDSPPRQGGGGAEAYNAQTAGYTQLGGNENTNSFLSSSGTRMMIHQPFDARGGNPDCLKGGRRRKAKTARKSRARKSRARKSRARN